MILRSKNKIHQLLIQKKYLIFDFDGVIVDSVKVKDSIFYELFLDDGIKIAKNSLNFHKKNQGRNRYFKIDQVLKKYLNNKIHLKEDYYMKFENIFLEKVKKIKTIPYLKNFLIKYKGNNKFFINSAAPSSEIKNYLVNHKLIFFFDKIYGSENNKDSNFVKLLNNIDRNKVIYFGDLLNDQKLSNKYNIDFCGINLKYKKKLLKKNLNYFFSNNFSSL